MLKKTLSYFGLGVFTSALFAPPIAMIIIAKDEIKAKLLNYKPQN